MLSYRHSYHAGNFADVIKHLCLVEILQYLTQKDKPLCYIDTHSGGGAYTLQSSNAQKNQEYLNGIGKLYQRDDLPEALANYCRLVSQLNSQQQLTHYPGSPWLAQQLLRDNDRLFFCELHTSEVPLLQAQFRSDKRIKVRHENGLAFLTSFLPPKEKRALVLIDPSYEIKSEYQQVVDTLIAAHKRFATGCYALWYPVTERSYIGKLEKRLKNSGIRNILLLELSINSDEQQGMTSSGMIIINPPWQLAKQMQSSLTFLANTLGNGQFRNEMLVAE